jgi:hypothetical protein
MGRCKKNFLRQGRRAKVLEKLYSGNKGFVIVTLYPKLGVFS